jgi:hypothetical protein
MKMTSFHLLALGLLAAAAPPLASGGNTPATPLQIEVRSTPLALPARGERGPLAADSVASDMAMLDIDLTTVSGYEVLPDGQIVIRCRQVVPASLQGAVIERRVGKELPR